CLADTVIDLPELDPRGEVIEPASGSVLFTAGERAEHLYVVLDGAAVMPATGMTVGRPWWVGPGDVCGEIRFVLGGEHTTTAMVFGPAPRLWRIHRDASTTPLLERLAR